MSNTPYNSIVSTLYQGQLLDELGNPSGAKQIYNEVMEMTSNHQQINHDYLQLFVIAALRIGTILNNHGSPEEGEMYSSIAAHAGAMGAISNMVQFAERNNDDANAHQWQLRLNGEDEVFDRMVNSNGNGPFMTSDDSLIIALARRALYYSSDNVIARRFANLTEPVPSLPLPPPQLNSDEDSDDCASQASTVVVEYYHSE